MSAEDQRYTLAVAAALGRPLVDHQQHTAEVCNAADVDDPRRFAHPVVVILAPRQVGKTLTELTLALGRGAARRDYRAAYTAQRGTVVTERFTGDGDGWIGMVEASPLGRDYRYRRAASSERITRVRGGARSFLRGFPPVDGALRSQALDLVVIDEAQEHDHDHGRALDATTVPVFTTRPARQLIVSGTAGTVGSWWHGYYARAQAGQHALVEIGTWPPDADPADEQVWEQHHPGLAAGLTDRAALRSALEVLGPAAFAREFGNRWDDPGDATAPIPLDRWDALTADPHPAGRTVAGFDCTLDRSRAWVATVTGRHVRLVADCHPTDLPTVLDRLGPEIPVWAPPGQAGIVDTLRGRGYRADVVTGADYRAGCQQLHDAVLAGTLTHAHQPDLRAAWEVAARSWFGDTWVLSARRSGGVIAPAVAAVVAWRAAAQHRDPVLA